MRIAWLVAFWITLAPVLVGTVATVLLALFDPSVIVSVRKGAGALEVVARILSLRDSMAVISVATVVTIPAVVAFRRAYAGSPAKWWFLSYVALATALALLIVSATTLLCYYSPIQISYYTWASYNAIDIIESGIIASILVSPMFLGGILMFIQHRLGLRSPSQCPKCAYELRATLAAGIDRCPECGWHVQRTLDANLRPSLQQENKWSRVSAYPLLIIGVMLQGVELLKWLLGGAVSREDLTAPTIMLVIGAFLLWASTPSRTLPEANPPRK